MLDADNFADLIEEFEHVRILPPDPALSRGSADEYMFGACVL